MSNQKKFAGTFVVWMGILDEQEGAVGYQFLEPGDACEMPDARIAGTITHLYDGETGGQWAFQPEPWVENSTVMQAVARNWQKFAQKIRDFNAVIGEN